MSDAIRFQLSHAADLLLITVNELKSILRISGISKNYEVNGHIGAETLRILHKRLYDTSCDKK